MHMISSWSQDQRTNRQTEPMSSWCSTPSCRRPSSCTCWLPRSPRCLDSNITSSVSSPTAHLQLPVSSHQHSTSDQDICDIPLTGECYQNHQQTTQSLTHSNPQWPVTSDLWPTTTAAVRSVTLNLANLASALLALLNTMTYLAA